MQRFTVDHLNATDFEEFCYDLLKTLKPHKIDWRKGTGLSSSPSDQGRDIECQFLRTEPGGREYLETWFVECKHYKAGVPFDKLHSALAWADVEKPDKLLFIASNFLSNQAKSGFDEWRKRKPGYRIDYWERPDLENMASGKSDLLKKYNISYHFSLISIMHPSHVRYFRRLPSNSLDYLFEQLDKLMPQAREQLLYQVIQSIMRPLKGSDDNDHFVFSYELFKEHCREIVQSGVIDQCVLTFFIVSYTLQSWLTLGDKTSINETLTKRAAVMPAMKKALESVDLRDAHFGVMDFFYEWTGKSKENKSSADMFFEMFQYAFLDSIPQMTSGSYLLYAYFCEQVVEKLLLERYLYDKGQ